MARICRAVRKNENLFPGPKKRKNLTAWREFRLRWFGKWTREKKSIANEDVSSVRGSITQWNHSEVKVSENVHNKFIITFDSLRCTTVHSQSILITFESYYTRSEIPNFHQTNANEKEEEAKAKIRWKKTRVHVPWTPNKHTHKEASFTTSQRIYFRRFRAHSTAPCRLYVLSRWWRWGSWLV